MASTPKKPSTATSETSGSSGPAPTPTGGSGLGGGGPQIITAGVIISSLAGTARRTGRKLVLLAEGEASAGGKALAGMAGLRVQSARESGKAAPPEGMAKIFPHLGIALVNADADQALALGAAAGSGTVLPLPPEEEFILFAAGMDAAWLRGYRDAVTHIGAHMLEGHAQRSATAAAAGTVSGNPGATWGVRVTRCVESARRGSGVRIAVLDTGLDLHHPDFRKRADLHRSFVPGQEVQDGDGHGTHCAGVAVGGGAPVATFTRYGAAGGAELLAGKVLDDLGQGEEGWIIAGIEWAIEQGCRVVSMSLSGQAPPSLLIERLGERAIAANTLLIAAAGNESNRPDRVFPVGYPANANSIMAVGALDRQLRVARFSNGNGIGGAGGRIDIAAPGVGVMSSYAGARLYRQESGTSMATPFVAGIAAMLVEADPGLSAAALFKRLQGTALALPGSSGEDVGAGLVQAPA